MDKTEKKSTFIEFSEEQLSSTESKIEVQSFSYLIPFNYQKVNEFRSVDEDTRFEDANYQAYLGKKNE